jgi:hypothetical protein
LRGGFCCGGFNDLFQIRLVSVGEIGGYGTGENIGGKPRPRKARFRRRAFF